MIDEAGDGWIDRGQGVAGREPARARLHNFFCFWNVQPFAVGRQPIGAASASENFLANLLD